MTPIIKVNDLRMQFPIGGMASMLARMRGHEAPVVRAVDSVSFEVAEGETLALVGESGCGKSTVARCILRLLDPTSGTIDFGDVDLAALDTAGMKPLRRDIQMVFQDPTASLNPRLTVRAMVEEPLKLHTKMDEADRREAVDRVLNEVGLGAEMTERYPHELSGGQRQRVNIARAVATNPRFVVLDEPTSALDVSLRSRAILLLESLRDRHKLAYLFISHDLATVKYLADRVAVMYLGRIVELAETRELFARPLHPYTRALLAAVPVPDPDVKREKFVLEGEVPSPSEARKGCSLRGRCPMEKAACAEAPPLREVSAGRYVACHFA